MAGNLKNMLRGIAAVGADAYNYGAKTVGSILVERMKVAGSLHFPPCSTSPFYSFFASFYLPDAWGLGARVGGAQGHGAMRSPTPADGIARQTALAWRVIPSPVQQPAASTPKTPTSIPHWPPCPRHQPTTPKCQGTNSWSPSPNCSLLVGAPLAWCSICSKMRWPISGTLHAPSMIRPQLMSMSSCRRRYIGVLLASLMVGAGLLPNIEPRPVVKQMRLAPLAIWPVQATGS